MNLAAAIPPDLPASLARFLAGEGVLALPPLPQVCARIRGRAVVFHLSMDDDPVQDAHRRGHFYERAELDLLAGLLPRKPLVLDVGANVGNHALYFALMCKARVQVVEPNPLALPVLLANVLGNRLSDRIALDTLGFGLSDREAGGYAMKAHDRNLGATRMQPDAGGPLSVRRGDAAFPDLSPDLVKIDVEGMELQALSGLDALIGRARPLLMVEVEAPNRDAFAAWAERNDYHLLERRPVSRKSDNHILLPPGHPRRGTKTET